MPLTLLTDDNSHSNLIQRYQPGRHGLVLVKMKKSDDSITAVILVGGEGTRLRPLTNGIPKSMVPVLNEPFLEHTIAYLKEYGVNKVILTLSYLPDVIREYFGDGNDWDTRLIYAIENNPLGTAGAVKNTGQHLKETFIVLNGDIFTDLDITDMLTFHRQKKSKVTIALTRVDNPCDFGVVETDGENRVERFIEKPSPEQVTSNWINAGIYIIEPEVLEYVPENAHYMFERGLFPRLLDMKEPLYGYRFDGYWLDMGTPEKYLCLNRDLLLSKVKRRLGSAANENKTTDGNESSIHPSAHITGPVLIADGCRISRGARIKGPVVIGTNCRIGEDAVIEDTVLWDGADIGGGAVLRECVIGTNTKVKSNERLVNRTVTGD